MARAAVSDMGQQHQHHNASTVPGLFLNRQSHGCVKVCPGCGCHHISPWQARSSAPCLGWPPTSGQGYGCLVGDKRKGGPNVTRSGIRAVNRRCHCDWLGSQWQSRVQEGGNGRCCGCGLSLPACTSCRRLGCCDSRALTHTTPGVWDIADAHKNRSQQWCLSACPSDL